VGFGLDSPAEMLAPYGRETDLFGGGIAVDAYPAWGRDISDLNQNYGKPIDQFLSEQYPGLELLLPSIQEAPGSAGAALMAEIADNLGVTQHLGVDALSNVAKGIDPAALSDPLRAREAEFRNEVAARAAGFD